MPLLAIIALVLLVVSFVITALLVKIPKVKPAALEEFEFSQVEEGTPQMVQFGDGWTEGGQVVWYGNFRTIKIKSKGGKK